MVNNHDLIIYKLGHKKGRKHDYNIYKETRPVTLKQVVNVVDLGYIGIEKDFQEQLSCTPNRKKRNHELSEEKIKFNQDHSKKKNRNRAHNLQIEKAQDNE